MKRYIYYGCAAAILTFAVGAAGVPALCRGASVRSKQNLVGHDARAEAAIRAVLDAQAAAWNRGDINGYMNGYAKSPETVFVSGDSITRGWQPVLDRYKKHYDSRDKMGTLAFDEIEINMLDRDTAAVSGRWQLKRANDLPHGRFTLIFKRLPEGWRIIHDHTSSAT